MPILSLKHHRITPAGIAALAAFVSAAILAWWDVRLVSIPLALFVLLSVAMPFFPRFSYFAPVISRGTPGKQAVAVTFDDGPDPATTPRLLTLLARHQVSATFFVTGKNVVRHPYLLKAILDGGHAVGNHSYTHDHCLFFRNRRMLYNDIQAAQKTLQQAGVTCQAFRPPVGIVPPQLPGVLEEIGLYIVNFSCRAFDGGNRRVRGLSRRILSKVRPADIVLLHDMRPKDGVLLDYWIKEMDQLLSGLKNKGLKILPLSDLIGKPVMASAPDGRKVNTPQNS